MGKINLESFQQILRLLMEAEQTLAALYRLFAQRSAADAFFWEAIAEQEQGHAAKIESMLGIVEQKPEKFSVGRMFTLPAVMTFIAGVRDNMDRVRKGELTPERFVPLALSIETSLLESRFYEMFISTDLEYNALRREIIAETQIHQRALRDKNPRVSF